MLWEASAWLRQGLGGVILPVWITMSTSYGTAAESSFSVKNDPAVERKTRPVRIIPTSFLFFFFFLKCAKHMLHH